MSPTHNEEEPRKLQTISAIIIILSVLLVRLAIQFEYTPDDTYIYLQYARNVIDHHEVAFNKGEPSYGVTGPLWLALISVTGSSGVDLYSVAKILDIVLAATSILAIFFLQRLVTGSDWVSLITAGVFSTHVWFLRWAGSGMETSLTALLSIITIHQIIARRYVLGGFCSALLTLVRPEAGVLVVMTVSLDFFILSRRTFRLKTLLAFSTIYALSLFPWYAYAYFEIGTIVPNTALAKSGVGFVLGDVLSTVIDLVKTIGVSDGASVVTILLACTFKFIRRDNVVEADEGRRDRRLEGFLAQREFIIPLVWIAALLLLYSLTSVNVVSRYLLLICPLIVLLVFAVLVRVLKHHRNKRASRFAVLLVAIGLVCLNSFVFETQVRPHMKSFATGMKDCFIYIGTWLHENTDANTSIVAGDIGAVGYYSQRRICDAAGLVSLKLLPLARMGYSIEHIMKEEIFRTYCNAGYVVIRSAEKTASHSPNLEPVFTRVVGGLGLSNQDTSYVTLFRIH